MAAQIVLGWVRGRRIQLRMHGGWKNLVGRGEGTGCISRKLVYFARLNFRKVSSLVSLLQRPWQRKMRSGDEHRQLKARMFVLEISNAAVGCSVGSPSADTGVAFPNHWSTWALPCNIFSYLRQQSDQNGCSWLAFVRAMAWAAASNLCPPTNLFPQHAVIAAIFDRDPNLPWPQFPSLPGSSSTYPESSRANP